MNSSHEFALYVDFVQLGHLKAGDELIIKDAAFMHRIHTVLRLQVDESLILFDDKYHAEVLITKISSKHITVIVKNVAKNKPMEPEVHWLLPLLKPDAFEEAVSMLTIFGVTTIQPVITQKTHRLQLSLKDGERLKKIMIAAAEQSKQFVLPALLPVKKLDEVLKYAEAEVVRAFFDPAGRPIKELVIGKEPKALICLVGPEGDLVESEKELLKKHNFEFYKLTPTVLRSQHAAALATGIIRSYLEK